MSDTETLRFSRIEDADSARQSFYSIDRSGAALSFSARFGANSTSFDNDDTTTDLDIKPFGFHARTSFEAIKELQKFRSKNFRLSSIPPDKNIWKRPPPDFRPQSWLPKPPKRNSRDAMQPWRYNSDSEVQLEARKKFEDEEEVILPKMLRTKNESTEKQESMKLYFRQLRPGSARIKGVRDSTLKVGQYHNPQPHDFRALPSIQSLGLDEFVTKSEKDPYNIRFLTKQKNIIIGPLHEIKNLRDASGTLWSAVRQPAKWENRLHLPLDKWPSRPNEYTRYRLPFRDPHEGFMDHVEETLKNRWRVEKQNVRH